MPMIVFGNGMFNADDVVKFKRHIAGIVNIIWKEIKPGERNGKLAAVSIDDYLTSQVDTLQNIRIFSTHPLIYFSLDMP